MTSTLPVAALPGLPAADDAAHRAGVQVRSLDTAAAVREAALLLAAVWRTDPAAPPLAAEVLRAVEHAGGYAVGAYRDGVMVGTSAGFLGLKRGAPVLHSHISGTTDQGRGVGLALKLHQRAWCLDRGIGSISWTFDPLVRRNAWFNLGKLGATGAEYLVDFYGPMTDGRNAGEASDRLLTVWDLHAPVPGARDVRDALLVLDAVGDRPVVVAEPVPGRALLVRLPADVELLRTTDPDAARCWREAVRAVLVPAFADGRTVRGATGDGCLLLDR